MAQNHEQLRNSAPENFHLMAKPAGPRCNLRCRYCFYTEKEALFEDDQGLRMSDEVLEAYVRKYIASQNCPEINFAWQGGEPTLMGVDFFRKAVELQKKYANGKRITNSLQTNGILLDDEWCEFLAEENFLVGLSIDGPKELHDKYRVDRGGRPTFDKVMASLKRMRKHGVEFNALASVTPESTEKPLEIYNFLKEAGVSFVQFIPIVERLPDEEAKELGLDLAEPRPWDPDSPTEVTEWSVTAEQYGNFLIAIFDEWVKKDVGRFYVQIFDIALSAWVGQDPSLCNFSTNCGNAMIIEYNGDVYSCDHFVYPDHRLGNILEDSPEDMVAREPVRKLGDFKWTGLPRKCRNCDVLFICHGGCPKNRFIETKSGEPGLNYLCEGYTKFFRHIDEDMKTMAKLLRQGRPPADIMRGPKSRIIQPRRTPFMGGGDHPGRNDPCPCGSGKKFKHCCGRRANTPRLH